MKPLIYISYYLPLLKSATTHPVASNMQSEMLSRNEEMHPVEEGESLGIPINDETSVDLDEHNHVSKA